MTALPTLDRDEKTGLFVPGRAKTGGRVKGTRNELAESFLSDLQAEWERRGKEALRELDPLDLARIMAVVSRPFVTRLAAEISEGDDELPEDMEALIGRAREKHGPRAAAVLHQYIRLKRNEDRSDE